VVLNEYDLMAWYIVTYRRKFTFTFTTYEPPTNQKLAYYLRIRYRKILIL